VPTNSWGFWSLFCLVTCLVTTPVRAFAGAGVQIDLSSQFNGDDVLRYSGSAFTTPSAPYDSALTSTGFYIVTSTAAARLATLYSGSNPVGINDNGLYPATGGRLYDVQFGFTNSTPTGANVLIRDTTVGSSFSFSVPSNHYSQFAIFGSSGSGSSTLQITLNYASGAPTVLPGLTLPDWFAGASGTPSGAAGTLFALTPTMSRAHVLAGTVNQYQGPAGTGAFIYGLNLAPDSTRLLTGVTVTITGLAVVNTVTNFFAAAGAIAQLPPATPAPSSLLLVGLGLAVVGFYAAKKGSPLRSSM